ncbi:uncharacterized protein LOC128199248 [Bicyclus anynana]|uniref:Uncharacterized protein LOC128199248 n=1 Tax=Bicyclus anynana TaxID=110368 RepID=A0ABM3LXX7_BICAN|nr:uncharacterized protein LOC128199248 [Bicyclus anynana]
MKLRTPIKQKKARITKIKWYNLPSDKGSKLIDNIRSYFCDNHCDCETPNTTWSKFENFCVSNAKNLLGISKGALNNKKDIKWWNNQTNETVAEKKRRFKIWQKTCSGKDREDYKVAKKAARRTVAIERDKAEQDLYARLELATDTEMYKLARQRHNSSKDFQTTKYVKNREGVLLTNDKDICDRWLEYYNHLLNDEFPRQ